MKKKVIRAISLTLLLLFTTTTLCAGAFALEITPRYTGIYALSADISITSLGRADCYGYVSVKEGYSVRLTVDLVQDDESIKNWSEYGYNEIEIEESHYVLRGHNYKVVATAYIYNPTGSLADIEDVTSAVVSY